MIPSAPTPAVVNVPDYDQAIPFAIHVVQGAFAAAVHDRGH